MLRRDPKRERESRPRSPLLPIVYCRIQPLHRLLSPPSPLYKTEKKVFSKTNSRRNCLELSQPLNTKMENTRVFVSGLPPSCSNDQLRSHFAGRFQVTDAHVLPKRRMGFVGFKSNDAATQAVKYFNRTYMKMSKISVDLARPVCWSCLLLCFFFSFFLVFFSFRRRAR